MARKGVDYRDGLAAPDRQGADYRQAVAEARSAHGVDWRAALASDHGRKGVDFREAVARPLGYRGVDWKNAEVGPGGDASDSVSLLLAADGGSFIWTGSSSSLLHGRKVTGGAGSYLLTGSNVTLTHPVSWSPPNLGSVVRAWYQMDLLTGSNGDPQSTITDSSGNSFTLTQAGSVRGTLAAADLNSLNTVRFTATSLQRYILGITILSGSTAASFYLIQKVVSASANNGAPTWGTTDLCHSPFSDGKIYDNFGSTVRKTVGTPTAALTSYRIISAYSATNDWAMYVDGGTGGSSGGTSPLFSTGTNTVGWAGSDTFLGANTGLDAFDGWYAEVIYTNAKQSDADRQKVEGYLAHKWGLTGNLDSSHPYKSSPPS